MFTYRCLDCGKQHSDPREFATEYQAACLRCSRPIRVTREIIRPAGPASSPTNEQATTAITATNRSVIGAGEATNTGSGVGITTRRKAKPSDSGVKAGPRRSPPESTE